MALRASADHDHEVSGHPTQYRRQTFWDWVVTIVAIGVFLWGAVFWADSTAQSLFSLGLAILCAVGQMWLWVRGRRSQPPDGPDTTGSSRIVP